MLIGSLLHLSHSLRLFIHESIRSALLFRALAILAADSGIVECEVDGVWSSGLTQAEASVVWPYQLSDYRRLPTPIVDIDIVLRLDTS